MQLEDSFKSKLSFGQVVEGSVRRHLQELLPDCTVMNTDQEKGSQDRDTYSLVDVVVLDRQGHPILGIECKRSETPYRLCLSKNGWTPENNTPLNRSSVRHYSTSTFPFYIVNINQFAHTIVAADLPTILHSRCDLGYRKPSGEQVNNYDSTDWMHWSGKTTIGQVLSDIINREHLC